MAGYGVVDAEGSRLRYVAAGILRAPAEAPLERRLAVIAAGLRDVVGRLRPQAAAVEDVFVKADVRAALAVGHARGALLAVLGESVLEVAPYPPATVKRAVAGNGRADKAQVARMVRALLGRDVPPETDATDALAVAVTHALRLGVQDLGA